MAERRVSNGTLLVAGLVIFAVLIAVGRTVLIRFGNTFQAPTTVPTTR
jgi:hypothetical protein